MNPKKCPKLGGGTESWPRLPGWICSVRLGGTRIPPLGREGASERRGLLFYPWVFFFLMEREGKNRLGSEGSGYFWKRLRARRSLSVLLAGLGKDKGKVGGKEPSQGIFQDFGAWITFHPKAFHDSGGDSSGGKGRGSMCRSDSRGSFPRIVPGALLASLG